MMVTNEIPPVRENNRPFVDRRKKPDWVSRSASAVAVLGWLLAFVSVLMLDRARPLTGDLWSNIFGETVVSSWNTALLLWSLIAIFASLIACCIGLFFNKARQKRKTDRYSKLLVVLSVFSLFFTVLIIINHVRYV